MWYILTPLTLAFSYTPPSRLQYTLPPGQSLSHTQAFLFCSVTQSLTRDASATWVCYYLLENGELTRGTQLKTMSAPPPNPSVAPISAGRGKAKWVSHWSMIECWQVQSCAGTLMTAAATVRSWLYWLSCLQGSLSGWEGILVFVLFFWRTKYVEFASVDYLVYT